MECCCLKFFYTLKHDLAVDIKATQDAYDIRLGRFADPIFKGHYPESLGQRLGSRLPVFSADDIAVVKGSSDFFGLNTYTTNLVSE